MEPEHLQFVEGVEGVGDPHIHFILVEAQDLKIFHIPYPWGNVIQNTILLQKDFAEFFKVRQIIGKVST